MLFIPCPAGCFVRGRTPTNDARRGAPLFHHMPSVETIAFRRLWTPRCAVTTFLLEGLILDQIALITAASALPPEFDHSPLSAHDQSRCMRLHFTGLDFNNNRNSTRRRFHKPGSVIIDCRFEGMRRYLKLPRSLGSGRTAL